MTRVLGVRLGDTDIIMPTGRNRELDAYRSAAEDASQEGVVTVALANAYYALFDTPFPSIYIGIPYNKLAGTSFDPSLVTRTK